MTLLTLGLYLTLGVLTGMLSGVVGIGGGILIIPALVYGFHMNQHTAQGTSLGALLAPVGALAFWQYYKAGNANLPAALLIALGFLIGGYFGGEWAQHLSEPMLRRAFGALLVVIGLTFLFHV
ncbi:MAG: TSUP family transporter [Candidatus Korobacteraceae bacterium]